MIELTAETHLSWIVWWLFVSFIVGMGYPKAGIVFFTGWMLISIPLNVYIYSILSVFSILVMSIDWINNKKNIPKPSPSLDACDKPSDIAMDEASERLRQKSVAISQSPDPAGAFLGILENTHSKIKPTLNPYNPADDNHSEKI